jgi:tetratricopeptide (TPR) repeat protein
MKITPDQSSSQVTPESPWLGLRPFTEDVREYFFGRDRELADLFERIAQKPLTVLFGQSGLGKTSLLQAALIPRLRHAGFVPILLRLDHEPEDPPLEEQVLEALRRALEGEAICFPDFNSPAPVWRLLHDPVFGLCRPGAPRVVLQLDQFEEIFTLGEATSERRADSHAFLSTLAEIVENRVPPILHRMLEEDEELADRLDYAARPLQVLLSLREDFLHRVERWRPEMPRVMDNRFELRLLTGQQALEAVIEPGRIRCRAHRELPPIVERQTGEEIVRFVAGVKSDVPLAEIDAVPPLLSLLCAELNAQRGDSAVIRSDQLGGRAEDILAQFYVRCFAPHPPAVRRFVEERLLSPEGFRQNANEDTFLHELSQAGLSAGDARRILARLVDDRLLVSEEHGSMRRIELTHDTLTGVARRSRDLRHQSEAAARRRRRRVTWIAAGASLLLLVTGVCVPLAFWALREKGRALEAKARAEGETQRAEEALQRITASEEAAVAAKEKAIASRKAADELINYMQYDLRDTLKKVGRLSLMQSIDERIARYHREHPPEAGDLAAERERSVMLVNQGDVLVAQGQLNEALKSYRDSLTISERLAKSDPSNTGWQRDLSLSYDAVGDVHVAQGQLNEALKSYRDGFAISERLAASDPKNAGWQRDLSISYNKVGDVQVAQGKLNEALKSFRDSLAIRERLAKSDPNNADRQRDLSVSYNKVGDVQVAQGKLNEALKSFRDSLTIRERLAKSDPNNAGWQRDLSVSYDNVGDALVAQGEFDDALKSYRDSLTITERLAKSDPNNADWQRDLSIGYQKVGKVAQRRERWAEAAEAFGRQVEITGPWLARENVDVQWLSIFAYGAGSCWVVLRDAPQGTVELDRAQVLADLRRARDGLRRLKDEGRLVPPMDKNLLWIERLLEVAEPK